MYDPSSILANLIVLSQIYGLIYGRSKLAINFTMNFYYRFVFVIFMALLIIIAQVGVVLNQLEKLEASKAA